MAVNIYLGIVALVGYVWELCTCCYLIDRLDDGLDYTNGNDAFLFVANIHSLRLI